MRWWSGVVVALALALVVLATLTGFAPGDSAGAVRMSSARELGLVSAGVALAGLLPLRRVSTVLTVLATLLLLVATGFWVGVVPTG